MAKNHKSALDSFGSFKKIVLSFLSVEIDFIGWLPKSIEIGNSIVARKPFIMKKTLDPLIQKSFSEISENVSKSDVLSSNGIKFFEQNGGR